MNGCKWDFTGKSIRLHSFLELRSTGEGDIFKWNWGFKPDSLEGQRRRSTFIQEGMSSIWRYWVYGAQIHYVRQEDLVVENGGQVLRLSGRLRQRLRNHPPVGVVLVNSEDMPYGADIASLVRMTHMWLISMFIYVFLKFFKISQHFPIRRLYLKCWF